MSHVGAFYVTFAALRVGATTIVARTFDGDELLPLLRKDRPTVLSMLPSALFALTRDHGAVHENFASLRLCRAAGYKVSAEEEREFTRLSGMVIDEAYGLTETGLVTVSPPAGQIKLGSVGQAVPGVSLSVRNDAGEELPTGGEGRLWIKTRAATVGYWDDPDATEAVFSGGWLDSGDVMRVDDEGYYFSAEARSRSSSTTARTSAPRRSRALYSSTRASRAPGSTVSTISCTVRTSARISRSSKVPSDRVPRR